MKKLLALLPILLCGASVQAQNIEGQIIASQYGKWKVPGYAPNTYSSFAPDSCRVQGGASFFFAFTVGTPITIVDANPSLSETVMPTATAESDVSCAVTIAPVNNHQVPFYLTSATGGLQEALNQNLTTPQTNTVILDSTFYQLVGGPANAAAAIAAAQGSTKLGLMDVTQVPTAWYQWNGTQYVKVNLGGTAGALGTLQNDVLTNNPSNSAAHDEYQFIADSPTVYTPQAAVNAAATNNGSAVIQPGAGRTPFTANGNVRVQDNRADVPATAIGVTEKGAVCDTRTVTVTLTAGSNSFSIINGTLTSADVGKILVAVGSVSGVPTAFETAVASITNSLAGTITTSAPFSVSNKNTQLGHDDTAAIAATMTAVGSGGTFIIPEGNCLTHTQLLKAQSPIGLGINSNISGFPGEDIFQAPDPSQTQGVNQGAAHIHDLTFQLDARIDATQAWRMINDSGTTVKPALYRPIAQRSAVANDPVAPGWFQGSGANLSGASNGVANVTAGSAVICVPTSETAPAVGQKIVFPYLSSVFTATVASSAGSCSSSTARTLNANMPTGSTNTQAEWFAGTSPQNLNTAITSGTCPTTITLANSINPVAGYESNVASFGLVQIDGEQFSYFGKSVAANPTPANTLYGVQCGQNGTARASHSVGATVFPLNNFQPSFPWPVTPTLNSGDTTPSGTAGYYPGWNVGNAAFSFPLQTGSAPASTGAWSANAKIENLSFFPYPGDATTQETNHTAMYYYAVPSYATTFSNLFALYLFYGVAGGPPSIENGNWISTQPTADGTHYDGLQLWAANPVNIPYGNQNTFSNFNVYSQEGSPTGGGSLGADTCFYFTQLWDDQTGGAAESLTLDHFKNLYCEPEGGPHAGAMPNWEWDTINSEIEDQHMGGGGEVYIGGAQQHWFGGNFNNSPASPVINWGSANSTDYAINLGSEPKGNTYGTNSLINFAPFAKFSGTTSQVFGSAFGPYGNMAAGNTREPIRTQTNETFNTGNLTKPYVSSEGGFITPEEFNANFAFEANAMSVGWTYDSTSPVTNAYTGCNVGNNSSTIYCSTYLFNLEGLFVGPGQRLVGGKYTMYISMKDAATASNTETMNLFGNCGGFSQNFTIPITNAWPSTAAGVFTTSVDLTSAGGAGCALGMRFYGATTADQVQIGYIDFAPVAEQFNAVTLNANNINLPPGSTGGTPSGCAQSPVTGINGGYTCPTKGWSSTLTANQGSSDTTIAIASTAGLSSAGCFFVDNEYECYTGISGSTLTGLTRGAYVTSSAAHNSGTTVASVNLVLGSIQQVPSDVIAFGGSSPPILAVNNPTPFNHGGASVFSINSGGNETWVDTLGGVHQNNIAANTWLQGSLQIGVYLPNHPIITDTGYLIQNNGANTDYQPLTLGGGHAGSLNVITTPTLAASTINLNIASGTSTISYVCSGTDFDGNLVPGTTASAINVASSWAFPSSIQVVCPYAAGVNTYQIYRTVGGVNQGLIASGSGPGFATYDFDGSSSGGTPPTTNGSNPHISVAGTGNPTITMGTASITFSTAAPSGSCVSGSLWSNSSGSPNTLYVCQSSAWVGK